MKTSIEKSKFLHLAYQMHVGVAVDHGCLEEVEAKVQHLHGELEAS